MARKIVLAVGLIVVVASALVPGGWGRPLAEQARDRLLGRTRPPGATAGHEGQSDRPPRVADRPADGLVRVDDRQARALGLTTAVAAALDRPIPLDLPGTTAYDPDTMTRIRPRFDTLVREVRVKLGQEVSQGDPLVELYSAALAEAKTEAQTARVEWDYRRGLRDKRAPLAESGAISQQLWAETQDQELHARLDDMVARDKLLVYGLSASEIDRLYEVGGSAEDQALMTLSAPTAGVVIARDVVPGNLYGPDDVLLVIAPLDHLWVWADVFEKDLPLIRAGLDWQVRFPFLEESVAGRIEYVADQVDPTTRAVRIRGSIPNPGRRFKADMLVRTVIAVPPEPGRVTIPRGAMISLDGGDFAFVRVADAPMAFRRQPIRVARETSREVVVSEGLEPGSVVAVGASLMLEELYDDLPAHDPGPSPGAADADEAEEGEATATAGR